MTLLGTQLFAGLASRATPAGGAAVAGSPASASVHMTAFEIVGERIVDLLAPALPRHRVQGPASPGQLSRIRYLACRTLGAILS